MKFVSSRNNCDALVRRGESRTIRTTRRSVSGIYAFRGQHGVAFESTLERDFLIRTELALEVDDVVPQPVRLSYRTRAGRLSHYTPDFLVRYRVDDRTWPPRGRPLLVEVKPLDALRCDWPDLRPKFKAAVRYARENGWGFRLFDEARIRDAMWENAMFLRPYRSQTFPQQDVGQVLGTLKRRGGASIEGLVNERFVTDAERLQGFALIWSLVARGEVACDFSRPLAGNTVVWVPTGE